MSSIYLVAACRTAIGSFGGSLKDVPATKLGEIVIRETLARAGVAADQVDEVIMGHVLQAGLGQNTARQASVNAGIPVKVPAYTVNKVCGSGLKSVSLAAQSAALGESDCIVAGGIENMSCAPYILSDERWGARMGNKAVVDEMVLDGLWDTFNDYHMGITAENIAEKYCISREAQDALALNSQQKAARARKSGRFKDEIVPVIIPKKKGAHDIFSEDEYIKEDTTKEKLAALRPAFKKDGTVTAGNASGLNDGAASVIVATEQFVKKNGLKPLAKICGKGSVGVDPALMGLGPIPSTHKALETAGLNIDDMDIIEANEAFAAQSIVVLSELGLNAEKVNVNGGAIALGHPIGASGARILVTLLYELEKRNLEFGLATLCIGGGMGETIIVQRDALCK